MINWLKSEWLKLIKNYCDLSLSNSLWEEIETQYTLKNRQYHNLSHIYNMLKQLEDFETKIGNLDSLKFTIWYHDIIYKCTKKDNEEKSAIFSEKRLKLIDFDKKRVEIVRNLIISTKKHQLILTQNSDNSYLLDLDLSILGTEWATYKTYTSNIRKEYKIYPDFMYKAGRKKVLSHFLERESLYFTKTFKTKFETQARNNLKREIELL